MVKTRWVVALAAVAAVVFVSVGVAATGNQAPRDAQADAQRPCVCQTTPAPTRTPTPAPTSPSSGTRGQTITYNEGDPGSCVYYVMDRFHKQYGTYPYAIGDARELADSAARHGWTVSSVPRVDSIAVYQPGMNGAEDGPGHTDWVEQIDGARIYVADMNFPDPWVISHRWINKPDPGVRYIYTN
jgi:surface antigen